MTDPLYNPEFDTLIDKSLVPFGVSVVSYQNAQEARGYTYTTRTNEFPPTPIFSPVNPFNTEIKSAKNVMEIGCGVGRNLPIIMEETSAHYWGVDPNEAMTGHFWEIQDEKYKSRVTIVKSFDELPSDLVIDFVLVTFVFQHIGFRPPFGQMNVVDISREAMKYTRKGTVWLVLEHEREEIWQQRWLDALGVMPQVYYKPGGNHAGGGTIPYPEFEPMTHRGNDNNLIIFEETK
jgi:SAM-dependent methyltransferase